MRQISRHTALGIMTLAAGIAVVDGDATWRAARAREVTDIDARVVAINIPGASAISRLARFLTCRRLGPVQTRFPPSSPHSSNRAQYWIRSGFGRQPVKFRCPTGHRRRAGGIVPVDRLEWAECSQSAAEFREAATRP